MAHMDCLLCLAPWPWTCLTNFMMHDGAGWDGFASGGMLDPLCGLAVCCYAHQLIYVDAAVHAQASGAAAGAAQSVEEGPAKRLLRRLLADEERADLPHEEKPWVPAGRPPTPPSGDVRSRLASCVEASAWLMRRMGTPTGAQPQVLEW